MVAVVVIIVRGKSRTDKFENCLQFPVIFFTKQYKIKQDYDKAIENQSSHPLGPIGPAMHNFYHILNFRVLGRGKIIC